jgi:hypothetical protein
VAPYDSSSSGASLPATRWTKLATKAISGPAVTLILYLLIENSRMPPKLASRK